MNYENERQFLNTSNFVNRLMSFGRELFTPVAKLDAASDSEHETIWCALIPSSYDALKSDGWDLRLQDGVPGFLGYPPGETDYERFGREDGIEPLVFERLFYGLKPREIEISEEFRHYHNLWFDSKRSKYYKFSESGDEIEIIRCGGSQVSIQTQAIKEFLAAKEMFLAVFLTIDRRVSVSLNDLQMEATPGDVLTGEDFIYYWHIQTDGSTDRHATSFLIGKKLISGYPKARCGISPFLEKKKNLDFIIGMDKDNKPILQNCAPETYNGRDFYLRTIFFKREVLRKYLDYPERYSIEDGILRCGQRWMISIDNNHADCVGIFLGDLARDMPESEQNHWKQFNIIAESGPSQVSLDRNFWCLATEPLSTDLRFKSTFEKFCETWKNRIGWHLFLPPNEGDKHVFTQLHVPTSESISEFESQISNLSRILVEPINESELNKLLDANIIQEKNLRGIGKLEEWLTTRYGANSESDILVLRQIQNLRNGIGHRKGDKYKKTSEQLSLDSRSKIEVITELLTRTEKLLINIEKLVLGSNCESKDKTV